MSSLKLQTFEGEREDVDSVSSTSLTREKRLIEKKKRKSTQERGFMLFFLLFVSCLLCLGEAVFLSFPPPLVSCLLS